MENLHIKYDFSEALNGKKNLLTAEATLIRIIKKVQNYKLLKSQEAKKKAELKTRLSELVTKINSFRRVNPSPSMPRIEEIELKASAEEVQKQGNLEQELARIQEQLSRLNN